LNFGEMCLPGQHGGSVPIREPSGADDQGVAPNWQWPDLKIPYIRLAVSLSLGALGGCFGLPLFNAPHAKP
jgi:hypothetical protein